MAKWTIPHKKLESLLLSQDEREIDTIPSHISLSLWGYYSDGSHTFHTPDSGVEWVIEPPSDAFKVVQVPNGQTKLDIIKTPDQNDYTIQAKFNGITSNKTKVYIFAP